MEMSVKNESWFLLFLFVLSFVVRAAVFMFYLGNNNNYWQVDSRTYHNVAVQVAQGKGFSNQDGSPHFYRLPGYPAFLALYYKFFGVDTRHVLWLQIFLASFIPLLIFFLTRALFPTRWWLAYLASLYSIVHLGLVLYAGFFMTESLFIFFFLIFSILFLRAYQPFFCCWYSEQRDKKIKKQEWLFHGFMPEPVGSGSAYIQLYDSMIGDELQELYLDQIKSKTCVRDQQTYRGIFCAGFFLGLASLVRPVGHYLIIVCIIMLLFACDAWRQKLYKVLMLFGGWFFPVSFWLIRNYLLTGYLFFHTLPGGHFLYLSAARVAMHVHHTSYQQARTMLSDEVKQQMAGREAHLGRPLNEIEQCQVHEKIACTYFKMRPWLAMKNWVTDMVRASFSLYSAELLYLDSGRKDVDYFAKGRGLWQMIKRYIFPQTNSKLLLTIIYAEIISYALMLLGFLLFCFMAIKNFFTVKSNEDFVILVKVLPLMKFFIIVALSGGYARMRLPVEPFLIILSIAGWWLVTRKS